MFPGHRSHGLGTADAVHLIDPEKPYRCHDTGIDLSAGRRDTECDLLHAGDLGGYDIHQDGGRIGGFPSGHVDPDAPQRAYYLPEEGALFDK
jgi:hypothetical protein